MSMFRLTTIQLSICKHFVVALSLPYLMLANGWADENRQASDALTQSLPPANLAIEAVKQSFVYQIEKVDSEQAQLEGLQFAQGEYEWEGSVGFRHRTDRVTAGNPTSKDYEVGIARTIRLPGKTRLDESASSIKTAEAKLLEQQAWRNASTSLIQAWFDCTSATGQYSVYQDYLGQAIQFASDQDKRFRLGEISKVALQQANQNLQRLFGLSEQAKLAKTQASQMLLNNFPNLQAVASSNGCSIQTDTPRLPDLPSLIWQEKLKTNSIKVKQAELAASLAANRAQRNLEDKLADPTVAFSLAREVDNAEQIAGVSISLPFGGKNRELQAQMANKLAQQTQIQLIQAQKAAELNSQSTVRNYAIQRQQLELLESEANLAEDLAAKQAKAYEYGEISYTELQLAKQEAFEAKLRYIAQLHLALGELAKLQIATDNLWLNQ